MSTDGTNWAHRVGTERPLAHGIALTQMHEVPDNRSGVTPSGVLDSDGGEDTPEDQPLMTRDQASAAVQADIARRRQELHEAMELPPHSMQLGASNMPHDCRIWAADWREQLPQGHPDRVVAERRGELTGLHSPDRIPTEMHRALRAAARRTGNAGPQ